MSRERKVGTLIERAQGEQREGRWPLHPHDEVIVAWCEEALIKLKAGEPLGAFEDDREAFIDLILEFVLPARRGTSVGPRNLLDRARRSVALTTVTNRNVFGAQEGQMGKQVVPVGTASQDEEKMAEAYAATGGGTNQLHRL
jgi:hypothetical protein